jgi:hypothetical protein
MMLPVLSELSELYRAADGAATACLLAKLGVEKSLMAKLEDTRQALLVGAVRPGFRVLRCPRYWLMGVRVGAELVGAAGCSGPRLQDFEGGGAGESVDGFRGGTCGGFEGRVSCSDTCLPCILFHQRRGFEVLRFLGSRQCHMPSATATCHACMLSLDRNVKPPPLCLKRP